MKKLMTPRAMLLIISAMFVLPLLLAWLMYAGYLQFKPDSTRNLGTLVEPPIPLDWSAATLVEPHSEAETADQRLLKHWVVLFPLRETCDKTCLKRLSTLRQVHLASGRNRLRIRLVVLLQNERLADDREVLSSLYDQFILATDTTGKLFDAFDFVSPPNARGAGTYLVDPLGNIMMAYAAASDPNDLKQDLKRLLTWSKLDEQS